MSILLPCSDKFSLQLFSFSFASFHFIYVVIWIIFSLLEEECISWIYDNSRYASWRTEIYHSTAHVGNSQVWRTTCSGKVTVDTWSDAWPRAALIVFLAFNITDLFSISCFLCRVCLLRRSFTRIRTTQSQ